MFKKLTFLLLFLTLTSTFNQALAYEKGDYYGYFGWNRSNYSNSDISFKGPGYDFKLSDVKASDRQNPLSQFFSRYLSPTNLTIPQYNIRFGYFIKDDLSISLGVDHMKYVMNKDQIAILNGTIDSGTYAGTYNNSQQKLTEDFLKFEHTDGLNLITIEMEKYYTNQWLKNSYWIIGGGAGIAYPKTNATILGANHQDKFKVAGWSANLKAGLEMDISQGFFTRFMYKKGYVDLPNISTSSNGGTASQNFDYNEYYLVFGYKF